MCSAQVNDWLYVSASLSEIIRIIHIHIEEEDRRKYMMILADVHQENMSWVSDVSVPIPQMSLQELAHAKDIHTVKQTLDLWRSLNNHILNNNGPLLPAKHIMPTAIALWNKTKGGIDVYSRVLKNTQAFHGKLPPIASVWLRLLMSLVYNAFQCQRLFKV